MTNCLILLIMPTNPILLVIGQQYDIKNIHCVNFNNHPLPYTTKCKYLGHIINNSLMVMTTLPDRQKRCLYAQANILALKCCLCSTSTITITVAYNKFHKKRVKASSYIQYPVFRTVQSALHFTPLTLSQLLWEASSHMLQLMREGSSYTYPPMSVARY